jgi:hypothetical protein
LAGGFRQRIDTRRFTAGLIVELPGEWNAAADYTGGSTKVTRAAQQKVIDLKLVQPLAFGTPGPDGLPILNPLAPWDEFRSALESYRTLVSIDEILKSRFSDASLRVAGPIVDLPGGPLTATALLERRREHVPITERRRSIGGALRPVAERTQTVSSAYVELRAPLTGCGWTVAAATRPPGAARASIRSVRNPLPRRVRRCARDGGGSYAIKTWRFHIHGRR